MFFHLKSALGAFQTPGSLGPFWLSCCHLSGSSLAPTDHKMESLQFCPAPSFLSSAVVSFLLLFGVPPKATSGPCVWPHSCSPPMDASQFKPFLGCTSNLTGLQHARYLPPRTKAFGGPCFWSWHHGPLSLLWETRSDLPSSPASLLCPLGGDPSP